MSDISELLAAKNKAINILLSKGTLPVTGIGISEKEDIVNIYVSDINEKVHRFVTEKLGGADINGHERRYIKTGIIRSLQCPSCLKSYSLKPLEIATDVGRVEYHRPIMGGDSIGSGLVSAGTLSSLVYDATTKQPLLLSNNHILSNSSSYLNPSASKGDIIYAPGCWDSPGNICDPTYQIGKLERFVPFNERELNFVDAAVALPDNNYLVSDEIRGLGKLTGHKKAEEGMSITKSGRSSGINSGRIMDISATLEVEYDTGKKFTFTNCVVSTPMGIAGDSGSLGLTSDNKAVAMLFSGSNEITVYSPIQYVMDSLNVVMTPTDTLEKPSYDTRQQNIYDTVSQLGMNVIGVGIVVGMLPTLSEQWKRLTERR